MPRRCWSAWPRPIRPRWAGRCSTAPCCCRTARSGQAFHKTLLPTYDVFDEDRYFEPAPSPQILELNGCRLGISICEDVWNDRDFWKRRRYHHDPIEVLREDRRAGHRQSLGLALHRRQAGSARADARPHGARNTACRSMIVNQVGGNDDLIFDGRSAAFDAQGRLFARAKGFDRRPDRGGPGRGTRRRTIAEDDFTPEAEIWNALVLGVRDYARKTALPQGAAGPFRRHRFGATAAIAADAMGPENVLGVMMPSRLLEPKAASTIPWNWRATWASAP